MPPKRSLVNYFPAFPGFPGFDIEFKSAGGAVVIDDHRLTIFDIALEQQPAEGVSISFWIARFNGRAP